MNEHIFLHKENVEEVLQKCLEVLKVRETQNARHKAFEDCSLYWKGEVLQILNSEDNDSDKIRRINKIFSF